MRLKEALLRDWRRESFDEIDSYLLRAVGGRRPETVPAPLDAVYDRAERRRVAHLLHGDQDFDRFEGLEAARRFAAVTAAHQLAAWQEITAAFDAAGIAVAGNKGPFLGALLDRPAGRMPVTTDLDLLVAEEQVAAAVAVLESLGYIRGLNIQDHAFVRMSSRSVRELEQEQGSFGQLAPMCRLLKLPELDDMQPGIERWLPDRKIVWTSAGIRSVLSVDLHFDLGHRSASGVAYPIPAAELLRDAVTVRHRGAELRTLDADTMTWLLCYRAYLDTAVFGERRFKPFADAAELIRARGRAGAAWDTATDRYPHIAGPVARTLRFLTDECGADLGAPVPAPVPDADEAPAPPAPRSAHIVVCHGWGSRERSAPWVAELRSQLAAADVTVEESAPFQDVTDPLTVGAAVAELRERAHAVRTRSPGTAVGFVGVSLGSTVALAAALADPSPDFLVAVSPVVDPVAESTGDDGGWSFLGSAVSPAFAEDLTACSPGRRLDRVGCPVLVLHGGQDNERRTHDAHLLAASAAARDGRSARQEFPAGNHTLDNAPVGAAAAVSTWLDRLGLVALRSGNRS
ncbi:MULTISPECIES: nucleotidyltransferase family protein [Streptomyces]|uniref:Dienelactone hydrolase n=1 Tax=Streptomyces demainii TaxID=588122 RepID=A0ABT9KU27_9ACTN|nr:nucleotidyltransferase family protein [Streptomyces demainii]MDP9611954.1 dienelactone hydrolase [Streptomyces demainii]